MKKATAARSDELTARVKALTDKLESGVKDVFESDAYKSYLTAMSKLHRYSFGNVLLILWQCPEASVVAGFGKWKKEFGRTVKPGEKGIQILAPVPRKKLILQQKIDATTMTPILGADGQPEKEWALARWTDFRIVYVFDISQTEGKEFPSYGVDELTGEVPQYAEFVAAIEKLSPVPIEFREPQASKGCYNLLEQKTYVNEGMSQVQTLKTLIHETAHAKLHALPVENGKIVGKPDKDNHTREVEAESIAYVVCQHFGIDTSDYSFAYVTGWSRGKKLPELKASLECISDTASEIIDALETACPSIARTPIKPQEKDEGNVSHRETSFSEGR